MKGLEANERKYIGHFEVDTVEGKKGDEFNISTMIDRSSKRLSATLYKGKSSTSFLKAIIQNISKQYF